MKNTDIFNIRKVLEYRKIKPGFKDGGDLSFEEINSKSTEELENLLTTNNQSVIPEIKALVDQIFQKFSDNPEDNMIALWAANYDDDGHNVYDQGCPMTSISFNGFSHEYNKFYYPIGSAWDINDVPKEYKNLTDQLKEKCELVGIKSAKDYYKDDNDALNEIWYGVIGIMKDYRVVAFVIRTDGMLCEEDSMDDYTNEILMQL
jgi:hypothetical protein